MGDAGRRARGDAERAEGDGGAGRSVPSRAVGDATWVTSTYFAEGLPYSVVNNLAEILFKGLGASLETIGLTALFHLPWNLKFLWGPFVDQYESKRRWLVGIEVVLTAVMLVLALLARGGASLGLLSAWFLLLAVLSATHDMAIDGYYLEALDARGQSSFVGYRAMAYRFAGMLVGGPLVMLAGGAGWFATLLAATVIMAALCMFHAALLPRVERPGRPWRDLAVAAARSPLVWVAAVGIALASVLAMRGTGPGGGGGAIRLPFGITLAEWVSLLLLAVLVGLLVALPAIRARLARRTSPYAAAFVAFLDQPRVAWILAFIVLYRTGESFLIKMRWPFLADHVGMTLDQYGFTNGTIGVLASFLGTFFGGKLISRDGLRRWIWPFTLAQNGLHLLYVLLAAAPTATAGAAGGVAAGRLPWVTAVIAVEQFGAGLGTAVFMVFLMRCADRAHKAAHMAIVTALMSVSFTLAGVSSGVLAEALGYARYFAMTFLVTIPSMAIIPLLPHLDDPQAAAAAGDEEAAGVGGPAAVDP